MAFNPIGIAVPFFFLLMGLEYWRLWKQGRPYRMNDTATNISCGLGDQMLAVFLKAFLVLPYAYCESYWGYFDFSSSSALTWGVGFVAVDFLYYWYHRFCHRVNLGWITHAVHHQSEEYNLAVALRQPWFGKVYSWIFYVPLAFLGIPVEVMATSFALNLLYQFWIHTELIHRMGIFEWVFNSPSHHRVHHGTNPQYVDKNYAGVLIVWDRLFGTFAEEDEKPVYGTLKPLRSWNPFVANCGPWIELYRRSKNARSLKNAILVWWKPPEWTEDGPLDPADSFMGPDRGYDRDDNPTQLECLGRAPRFSWVSAHF